MKKALTVVLILAIVAGICVLTCPDKASHSEALKDVLNTALTDELSENDYGFALLGAMIGSGIGGMVIDNLLKVDNYFVCSIGTMTFDGETKVVSVGVMNHVFVPNKEDLLNAAEE